MNCVMRFGLTLIILASLALTMGCAHLINGSTQKVPIKLPKGTSVFAADEEMLPIYYDTRGRDTFSYLLLERGQTYQLRLVHNGEQHSLLMDPELDPEWLPLDIVFLPIVFVDLGTHAFNWFEGRAVHFRNDAADTAAHYREEELYEPDNLFSKPLGLVLRASVARTNLTDFSTFSPVGMIVNEYSLGAGYAPSDRLLFLGTWQYGTGAVLLPASAAHVAQDPEYSLVQLEASYKYFKGLYAGLGGGVGIIATDSVIGSKDNSVQAASFPGFSKRLPVASVALGYAGRSSFIELRYTRSLSRLNFPSGESAFFSTLSIGLGFNIHF